MVAIFKIVLFLAATMTISYCYPVTQLALQSKEFQLRIREVEKAMV